MVARGYNSTRFQEETSHKEYMNKDLYEQMCSTYAVPTLVLDLCALLTIMQHVFYLYNMHEIVYLYMHLLPWRGYIFTERY